MSSDGDDVDSVKEILAKCARFDRFRQIAIRRRDHAHIDLRLDIRSDLPYHTILQHSQQLDLHRGGRLPNLIQKNRPSLRLLKKATLLADGAGEGAALVPKQLRLEQVFRKCAAVDGDKLSSTSGVVVDRAGDQLLSGTRLA